MVARPAPGALQIDEVTHGAQVRGIFGERCDHGVLESRGTVGIEQIDETAGE